MKPMPYREIDLQIGRAQTGFRTGALPSPAAEAGGAGDSWLHRQAYNPMTDPGLQT
jgi:hypothetical protein